MHDTGMIETDQQ